MQFKQWLAEMPIGNAELLGSGWKKFPEGKPQHQNWDKASYNILTKNGLEKLRTAWNKTPVVFDMYFLKKPGMREFLEIGEVDQAYLEERLGLKLQPNPDHVTVIFTNNRGAERVPMTPWTAGHRFGHAARRNQTYTHFTATVERDFREILSTVYGKERPNAYMGWNPYNGYDQQRGKISEYDTLMRKVMEAFGSMRSARTGNLRNYNEFTHELLGQYIINGAIKFRTEVPRQLTTRYAWGRPSGGAWSQAHRDEEKLADVKDKLEKMANTYNYLCEEILHECVGKIFVM